MDSFCAWDGETLVLNILGKPGSNRDAIGKVKGGTPRGTLLFKWRREPPGVVVLEMDICLASSRGKILSCFKGCFTPSDRRRPQEKHK